MPRRWMHETLDLIVFGRSYWRLHKWKDSPWETLGGAHRRERHDYYNRHGLDWTHEDTFPESVLSQNDRKLREGGPDDAEMFQADLARDVLDRCWDNLNRTERKAWVAAFRRIILDPHFLRRSARVDVLESTIEATDCDGQRSWDYDPDVKCNWLRLTAFVEHKRIDELV